MWNLRTSLPLSMAAALAAAACGDTSPPGGSDGTIPDNTPQIRSNLTRVRDPQVSPEQLQALVEGNQRLTFDLYRRTAGPSDNYMISTLSIQTAFALVYAGARTTTAEAMAQVLAYDPDPDAFHRAMNALDLALRSRELAADPAAGLDPVELRQANALFSQEGFPWASEYLDVLALNYEAGVRPLDFPGDPDGSRRIINGWVEDQTRDRIRDLLPDGSIRANTVAVLTNAIYFKAPWDSAFEDNQTHPGDFERTDGSQVTADFMTQMAQLPYGTAPGLQAVELPYRGEALSMVLLMPTESSFEDLDRSLTAETVRTALDDLESSMVELSLPKFEFETEFTLKDALSDLGLSELFAGPDLSGMAEGAALKVDEAYHKTFVAVDEKGTEAAAATAVVIVETSVPVVEHTLRLDRPFYFLIRDRITGVWLFFGRVMDPSA